MNKLEFKQIACSLDAEGNDYTIALDHRGQVWMYVSGFKPNEHRGGHTPGWQMLHMEESQTIPKLEKS